MLKWVVSSVRVAGWAPIAVLAVHVALLRVGWYLTSPLLDVAMHLLGGAAIAFFVWCSIHVPESRSILGSLTATASGLLSFAATGTSAVVWELAEWVSDRYLGTHSQLWLGDTLLDMFLGLVGGLALMTFVKFCTSLAWPWFVLVGSSATFLTGIVASFILERKSSD